MGTGTFRGPTKRVRFWAAFLLISGLLSMFLRSSPGFVGKARAAEMSLRSDLEGTVRAPDFPKGADWLNVSRPLTMGDLRGRVVLLDFWTFCCINCMHVIPDLKRLESEFGDSLVVVGVHSAKFSGEKDSANIREAVLRYGLTHPVVNDSGFVLWKAYGIHAWPSFALIDAEGRVAGTASGEGVYGTFQPLIRDLVDRTRRHKSPDPKPLPLAPEKDRAPRSLLSFPGKLAVDEAGGRLFISDSGHHRIVVAALDGKVLDVVGDGREGLKDGPFGSSRFTRPQGVFYDATADILYVADTENHALRAVRLKERNVVTLAGSGRQASFGSRGGLGPDTDLNSPWDVLRQDGKLYIAMAGSHQIWTYDLKTRLVEVFAGSGREDLHDADRLSASLAQPSGLATDGKNLYFADSETSSIRRVSFDGMGRVETLVGRGLFDFGDRVGPAADALFQHPVGLAFQDGVLYVADTYNNKLKRLDPKTGEVLDFLGSKTGWADGDPKEALLNEPCGLAFAGGRIYIADTDNNAVRVYDGKTRRLSTLELTGLGKLEDGAKETAPSRTVELPALTLTEEAEGLHLGFRLPPGVKMNAKAPFRLKAGGTLVTEYQKDLFIPLGPQERRKGRLVIDLTAYTCSEKAEALCYLHDTRYRLPLRFGKGGPASPRLEIPLE